MEASENMLKYELEPLLQKFDHHEGEKTVKERAKMQCWKCSMRFPSSLDLEEHIENDHGRILS